MTDDGLRALAAALARIEMQQAQLLEAVEALQVRLAPAGGELLDALADYFGNACFTAGVILLAVDDDPHGRLAEAVAAVVDPNLGRHAQSVALGLALRSLPGLQRAGGQRGALLWRVRV